VPQSTAMKPSAQRMPRPLHENIGARLRSRFSFRAPRLSTGRMSRQRRMRRRRPRRARRRAGVGRARAGALLGRHQGPEDLPPRPKRRSSSWDTPFRVGSLAPRAAAASSPAPTRALPRSTSNESLRAVANPEARPPDNRFNDGKVDRAGRFWAGTMDDKEREARRRALPARSGPELDRGSTTAIGHQRAGVQPDGRRMYHNDSARGR
jgi:hypothetical protein